MVTQHMKTTATIDTDIDYPYPFDEVENLHAPNPFRQNTRALFEFGFTAGTILESRNFIFDDRKRLGIQEPADQSTSAVFESNLEEEFWGTQQQRLSFPDYSEQTLEVINLADDDMSDIMPSRVVEQEVLDLLDEPVSR